MAEHELNVEISDEVYQRLLRIATETDRSLDEILQEAAVEYARTHDPVDPDDPLFAYEPSGESDRSVTATKTDEYLYSSE
ncbi:MAG: hypothetical protein ABEH35_00910 [Haloarculaceae archaeon]